MENKLTSIKQDDFVESLFTANTHDFILCFSNLGQVYWLKVYEVPRAGRGSRGKPIVNLLKLLPHEKVTSILPIKSFDDDRYVFMATLKGTVKKLHCLTFQDRVNLELRLFN